MDKCLYRENSAFLTSWHALMILFVKYKLLGRVLTFTCVYVSACKKQITGKQPSITFDTVLTLGCLFWKIKDLLIICA